MGKISDMTAAAALTGVEQLEAVQSAATVRTTAQDIADLVLPTGSEDDLVALDATGDLKTVDSGAYALAADAMIVVKHDDNAAEPRPDPAGAVYWQGSVEPDNGADGDLWYDSTGDTP